MPLRFADALQRPLELKQRPRRIVSLVPSLTEMLFALGLGEAVVGVTKFCVEPKEEVSAKARVGGTKTLDVEKVLDLAPDLVIANAEENRQEDIERLIGAGLTVYVSYPRTVAGAIDMMRQVAEITDTVTAARPVIQAAERALTEVQAATRGQEVRVFCPIWRNPWMTIGPDTYMHDVIAACGGRNVFGDRPERYPRLELAEVADRDPEVVLLPDEPYRFAARHIPELTALSDTSAFRSNCIHLLEGKHLCWYGPRIAGSLRLVARLIQGAGEDGPGA